MHAPVTKPPSGILLFILQYAADELRWENCRNASDGDFTSRQKTLPWRGVRQRPKPADAHTAPAWLLTKERWRTARNGWISRIRFCRRFALLCPPDHWLFIQQNNAASQGGGFWRLGRDGDRLLRAFSVNRHRKPCARRKRLCDIFLPVSEWPSSPPETECVSADDRLLYSSQGK